MTNLEMLQSLTVDEVARFIAFVEKKGEPCRYFEKLSIVNVLMTVMGVCAIIVEDSGLKAKLTMVGISGACCFLLILMYWIWVM